MTCHFRRGLFVQILVVSSQILKGATFGGWCDSDNSRRVTWQGGDLWKIPAPADSLSPEPPFKEFKETCPGGTSKQGSKWQSESAVLSEQACCGGIWCSEAYDDAVSKSSEDYRPLRSSVLTCQCELDEDGVQKKCFQDGKVGCEVPDVVKRSEIRFAADCKTCCCGKGCEQTSGIQKNVCERTVDLRRMFSSPSPGSTAYKGVTVGLQVVSYGYCDERFLECQKSGGAEHDSCCQWGQYCCDSQSSFKSQGDCKSDRRRIVKPSECDDKGGVCGCVETMPDDTENICTILPGEDLINVGGDFPWRRNVDYTTKYEFCQASVDKQEAFTIASVTIGTLLFASIFYRFYQYNKTVSDKTDELEQEAKDKKAEQQKLQEDQHAILQQANQRENRIRALQSSIPQHTQELNLASARLTEITNRMGAQKQRDLTKYANEASMHSEEVSSLKKQETNTQKQLELAKKEREKAASSDKNLKEKIGIRDRIKAENQRKDDEDDMADKNDPVLREKIGDCGLARAQFDLDNFNTARPAGPDLDPAVKEWIKANKKKLDSLNKEIRNCENTKAKRLKDLDDAKKSRKKARTKRDRELKDAVAAVVKYEALNERTSSLGRTPAELEEELRNFKKKREASESDRDKALSMKAKINAEGGADVEQREVDRLKSVIESEQDDLTKLLGAQGDASKLADKNEKAVKEKEYAARVSLIKRDMGLCPVIDDTIARDFIRDHKGEDGELDKKDGDFLIWVKSKRPKAFEVTVYHSCFGGEGKTANFRQVELTAKPTTGRVHQTGAQIRYFSSHEAGTLKETLNASLKFVSIPLDSEMKRVGQVTKVKSRADPRFLPDTPVAEASVASFPPKMQVSLAGERPSQYRDFVTLNTRRLGLDESDALALQKGKDKFENWKKIGYLILFTSELYDWMSDWAFYSIAVSDDNFKCLFSSIGFYEEYEKACLFFNIVGTIAVLPAELVVIFFRLFRSQDHQDKVLSYLSSGVLLSILLEDFPQLILQLYYASLIGFDSIGVVSSISLCLTGTGLLVAVYMSWTFITNMYIVLKYKKADIGKEPRNTLQERNEGDFVSELWGLFVLFLGTLQFLDFVAGWAFYGKTIVGAGQESFRRDMAAAGEQSGPFEMAMLGLCLFHTGVMFVRLHYCRKYYKGDAKVYADQTPEKRKGLGELDRPAQMVFGPLAIVSAVAIDIPFLALESKYFEVSGISRASDGLDAVAVFAVMFSLINIFVAVLMAVPFIKIVISKFVLGRIAGAGEEVMETLYLRHGYKTCLGIVAVLHVAAVFAVWGWLGQSVISDKNFYLIWTHGIGLNGQRGEGSYSAFVTSGIILCVLMTIFAIIQLVNIWQILTNDMEGMWTIKVSWKGFTKIPEEKQKPVHQEGRTVPKRLTKWTSISALLTCLPLLVMMTMYSQAMSEVSVKVEILDAYHKCATASVDLSDFTECVCIETKGNVENCFTNGDPGVDIVSLGPTGVCAFGIAMLVLQLMVGVFMGWLYVNQKYKFRWKAGFALMVIEVTQIVCIIMFWSSSVVGGGSSDFMSESLIDPVVYEWSLFVFGAIGTFPVPYFMFKLGRRYKDDPIHAEQDKIRREYIAVVNERYQIEDMKIADMTLEDIRNIQSKDDEVLKMRQRLKFNEDMSRKVYVPSYITALFTGSFFFKLLPQLVLISVFIDYNANHVKIRSGTVFVTPIAGTPILALLSTLICTAIALRVMLAWLKERHPKIQALVVLESIQLLGLFIFLALDVVPKFGTNDDLAKLSLALVIVSIIATIPTLVNLPKRWLKEEGGHYRFIGLELAIKRAHAEIDRCEEKRKQFAERFGDDDDIDDDDVVVDKNTNDGVDEIDMVKSGKDDIDEEFLGFGDEHREARAEIKAIEGKIREHREELEELQKSRRKLPYSQHYVPSYVISGILFKLFVALFPTMIIICLWIMMEGSSKSTTFALLVTLCSVSTYVLIICRAMYKWHPGLCIYAVHEFVQLVSMWLYFSTTVIYNEEARITIACAFFGGISTLVIFPVQLLVVKWFLSEHRTRKILVKAGISNAHLTFTPPNRNTLVSWPVCLEKLSKRLIPAKVNTYQAMPWVVTASVGLLPFFLKTLPLMIFLVLHLDAVREVSGIVVFATVFTASSMIICLAPLFRHGWKARADIIIKDCFASAAALCGRKSQEGAKCCGKKSRKGGAGFAKCLIACCQKCQECCEENMENEDTNDVQSTPRSLANVNYTSSTDNVGIRFQEPSATRPLFDASSGLGFSSHSSNDDANQSIQKRRLPPPVDDEEWYELPKVDDSASEIPKREAPPIPLDDAEEEMYQPLQDDAGSLISTQDAPPPPLDHKEDELYELVEDDTSESGDDLYEVPEDPRTRSGTVHESTILDVLNTGRRETLLRESLGDNTRVRKATMMRPPPAVPHDTSEEDDDAGATLENFVQPLETEDNHFFGIPDNETESEPEFAGFGSSNGYLEVTPENDSTISLTQTPIESVRKIRTCNYKSAAGRQCNKKVNEERYFCSSHLCPECQVNEKSSSVTKCNACTAKNKG